MSEIGGGEIIQRLIHPDRERHLAIEREAAAPLDVERLADALKQELNKVHPAGQYEELAAAIAAEYARLAEPVTTP